MAQIQTPQQIQKEQELQALDRYFSTALKAGCPRPQIEHFYRVSYFAYPWQLHFHSRARAADLSGGPTKIGLGGARGPGKSHAIFEQVVDDCLRVDGLKFLFLRQTAKAGKESMEDLIIKTIANRIPYEYTSGVLKFANGSRVVMGGFKDEKDIDKYIGIEYDGIAIEEINQLSEKKVEMLLGSMRTTKDNWRPRLYASFNPGGRGHGYVKKTFVLPHKRKRETDTAFIPATWKDNPILNKEYIDYLLGLKGQLGQAWRDGDFDIMAGAFFPEWNEEIHTCASFPIPREWKRICFLDYGHGAQSALYWAAIAPDGKMYVYRELYRPGLTFSKLADEFVTMTPPDERIDYLVADPSIWSVKGENAAGLSGYEIFTMRYKELTRKEIRMVKANNDRQNGWSALREWLSPFMEAGVVRAKLQIFKGACPDLVRVFPEMIHDENNPEDMDSDEEDHALDSLRYGIMSKPIPFPPPPPPEEEEKPRFHDIGV